MVFSVAALAWTEKEGGLKRGLGRLDEVCRENETFWKKGELEEAKEDLMKGKEGCEEGVDVVEA